MPYNRFTSERDLRPAIHFTPPHMWMNDPNGMLYENGTYHLFYQHCPFSPTPGSMHWGHAVSRDLIHWQHRPIAVYPDELGVIFSGSGVYDKENTSGFGTKENPPMIAMFTSHGKTEQQSIAYSLDGGEHFEKYYGNPVIPNRDLKDFRDPKVFWNPVKACWSVIVAAGDRAHFYASPDLRSWTKTGEFGAEGNPLPGIWECPDLLRMEFEGKEKWVLIANMIADGREIPHRTQYFIGDFDGDRFICTEKTAEPLLLDGGLDNYAGVTFQNTEKPILIGWALNWSYATVVPTGEFRGQMTLARQLSLQNTAEGLRLASEPLGLEPYRAGAYPVEKETPLYTDSFGLLAAAEPGSRLILSNEAGEKVILSIGEETITLDRTASGRTDFSPKFALPESLTATVKRKTTGTAELELIFDVSILELFAENGLTAISSTVYPQHPYTRLTIEGNTDVLVYPIGN